MSVVQLSSRQEIPAGSFFDQGFRPFFLAALISSLCSMVWWFFAYQGVFLAASPQRSSMHIHAHEMVYGYTTAVIAGFLLTAVPRWVSRELYNKRQIVPLLLLWLSARVLVLGHLSFLLAAIADLAFSAYLGVLLAIPLVGGRHWKQMGVLSKVLLLGLGNLLFYSANDLFWVELSLQGGLLLEIGLILTIAGRVFPGFIENGMSEYRELSNPRSLSILTLLVFVIFTVNRFTWNNPLIATVTSFLVFVFNFSRLWLWYSRDIWRNPLLWSLYLSLVGISFGFLLFAMKPVYPSAYYLGLHALAVGGIGFATLGMMGRVILGHSGGSVHLPPAGLIYAFLFLGAAFLVRVLLPLLTPASYPLLMSLGQFLWFLTFVTVSIIYGRLLIQK